MTAARALAEAARAGAEISTDGHKLKIRTTTPLPLATLDLLTTHKAEIVAKLSSPGLAPDGPVSLRPDDPGDAGLEWLGEYETHGRDRCRHCGEIINWATDGTAFADGKAAHNACYEASRQTGRKDPGHDDHRAHSRA